MNLRLLARLSASGISMLAFSGAANANAGVPMLFITMPAMLIALIPIIVIEAIVIGRCLGSTAFSFAKSVTISNVVSTIVGLPLTWISLVVLQLVSGGGSAYGITTPTQKLLSVTWQAPWLIPYETDLYWMLPASSLSLLIPFFFTSFFVEAPIVSRLEHSRSRSEVRAAVFRANIFSYSMLAMFTIIWLTWSIQNGLSNG